MRNKTKQVLVIAGLDPSMGAGLGADITVIQELGVFVAGVVTVIVAQNSKRVSGVFPIETPVLGAELDSLIEDYDFDAVKISMMGSVENARYIEKIINTLDKPVVLDPIQKATTGGMLSNGDLLCETVEKILPNSKVVIPNIYEASFITGYEIKNLSDVRIAAKEIKKRGVEWVLIKGGHLKEDVLTDTLFDGENFFYYEHKKYGQDEIRGTGCILSSALTGYIALGYDIKEATAKAVDYVQEKIAESLVTGNGKAQAALYRKKD